MKRAVMTAAALTLTPCLGAIPVLASPEAETVHVVKPGETLNGVANRAGVSASAIAKANDLQKPYVVKAGEQL
ncbi:LysM domain-containing protein, partial [Novosphingobium sp.]|uniref:LysM peptidoglycan-binding domain-containing protein n=1 Tax=Novosphingobium sp. TaxID=1874826 RepID=UPI002B46F8DB